MERDHRQCKRTLLIKIQENVKVQNKIIQLLAQVKDDETVATRVTGSSHLVNDVGLDSLQLINLILLVEEEFAVEVDFESLEVSHLSSLDRFTSYVASLPRV